jgi:CRISPR type III-B/RAMP module-associated protein Cmr5
MRKLQQLIPTAIKAIKENEIADEYGKVEAQFKGYVSSFGSSMIRSGLFPTVIFYSQKGGAESDRPRIVGAINHILSQLNNEPNFNLAKTVHEMYQPSQLDFTKVNRLTSQVEDALVVLKLALRIFDEKKLEDK